MAPGIVSGAIITKIMAKAKKDKAIESVESVESITPEIPVEQIAEVKTKTTESKFDHKKDYQIVMNGKTKTVGGHVAEILINKGFAKLS